MGGRVLPLFLHIPRPSCSSPGRSKSSQSRQTQRSRKRTANPSGTSSKDSRRWNCPQIWSLMRTIKMSMSRSATTKGKKATGIDFFLPSLLRDDDSKKKKKNSDPFFCDSTPSKINRWKSGLYIDYVRLVDLDDPVRSKDRISSRAEHTGFNVDEPVNDEGEEYYPSSNSW